MYITVLVGKEPPFIIDLDAFGKERITFGSAQGCDIVMASRIASSLHGSFIRDADGWKVRDEHSKNGLYVNEEPVGERTLIDGLKLYIGSMQHDERVIILCSSANPESSYQHFPLDRKDTVRIGRNANCDIRLDHVGVSQVHAELTFRDGGWHLRAAPRSEIRLNSRAMTNSPQRLSNMNRFLIANTQFLYRDGELIYYTDKRGLSLEATHVSKVVGKRGRRKTIVDDVSLRFMPGEFIAIVGGSGAGKSSLMKCISGISHYTGSVLLQGEDLQCSYESLKKLIGYVPQEDIVYDDLTLERMLHYSAKLRMPSDSSEEDIRVRVAKVLKILELTGFEQVMIRNLSGGQKKRASIAVELLSDPGIFFLDEPTSGLDPGTEQNLMRTLKQMTQEEKTIILVTHTPLNLMLCDKIVFMGPGGKLCYYGSPRAALEFFGVESLVDIYNMIGSNPDKWRNKYLSTRTPMPPVVEKQVGHENKKKASFFRQWRILSGRYMEIMAGDKKKLMMQFMMAPILGVMLCLAFRSGLEPFKYWSDTETFSIAMSCCFFWMGLFQSIQEISKERVIIEREKMADLKTGAYLASKVVVIGGVLLLQCLVLLGMVWVLIGHPESGVLMPAFPEFFLTAWLTAMSAAALGLCVSAMAGSTDQAVSTAPFLLIPQILFSGVICDITGIVKYFTYVVSCNWSCIAFCASSSINDLYNKGKELAFGTYELTSYSKLRYSTVPPVTLADPVPQSLLALLILCLVLLGASLLALRKRKEL